MQRNILKLMPAAEVGEAFDRQNGRQTKDLHSLRGMAFPGKPFIRAYPYFSRQVQGLVDSA